MSILKLETFLLIISVKPNIFNRDIFTNYWLLKTETFLLIIHKFIFKRGKVIAFFIYLD